MKSATGSVSNGVGTKKSVAWSDDTLRGTANAKEEQTLPPQNGVASSKSLAPNKGVTPLNLDTSQSSLSRSSTQGSKMRRVSSAFSKPVKMVHGHFGKAFNTVNEGAASALGIETDQDTLDEKNIKQGRSRRILRMSIITTYFLGVILWFFYCFTRVQGKSESEVIQVSLDEDIFFDIQNCVLHVHVDAIRCDTYSAVDHPHCDEDEHTHHKPTLGHALVWHVGYLPMQPVGDDFKFTHERKVYNVSDSGLIGNWTSIVAEDEGYNRMMNLFTLTNTGLVDMHACEVTMNLLVGAELTNLNIRCRGDCVVTSIVHEVETPDGEATDSVTTWSPKWNVRQSLTVAVPSASDDKSGIMLSGFSVGWALLVEINVGDVYLEDFEISHNTTVASEVLVWDGDLYGQNRGSMKVLWTGSTAYYCMASGTNLQSVDYNNGSCPAWVDGSTTDKGNESTLQLNDECAGSVMFCPEGGSPTNATHCTAGPVSPTGQLEYIGIPTLYLQVPKGSYYMSTRVTADEKLPYLYAGDGFNSTNDYGRRTIAFDEMSSLAFENTKTVIGNSANSDKAYVFQGPSSAVRLMRPSNAFMFTILPSVAYGQMRPWWMSFLSMSMLIHEIESTNIRFRAGPCPYRVATESVKIGDIYDTIKTQASVQDDTVTNEVFYILNSDVPVGAAGNRPLKFEEVSVDWLMFASHGEKWWRAEATSDGSYEWSETRLISNGTLMAACIISVVVSTISGAIGVYLAWSTVSAVTWYFSKAGSHIKRYDKMFQQSLDAEDADEEKPDIGTDKKLFLKTQTADLEKQETVVDFSGVKTVEKADTQLTFSKTGATPTAKVNASPTELNGDKSEEQQKLNRAMTHSVKMAEQHKKRSYWMQLIKSVPGMITKFFTMNFDDESDMDAGSQQKLDAAGILGGRVKLISFFRLPSMFCYVDHVATLARKRWFNSLADFLELTDPTTGLNMVREVTNSADVNSVSHKEFKDVYSQFCFLLDRVEINLHTDGAKAIFERNGLKSVQVAPSEQPFAFTRIRFKTQRETDAIMHLPDSQALKATETSLDFFLRVECQRTSFDAEQIELSDFNSRYKLFCDKKRLNDQVAVSKASMAEKGINSQKVEAFRLVPAATDDGFGGGSAAKVVHLESARNHVNMIVSCRHGTLQQTKERLWWLQDLGVVTAHFMIINIMALPCNAPAFWLSAVYGQFSTRDDKLIFEWQDFKTEPYLVLFKAFHAFPILFFLFTIPGIIQWVCGFVELLSHYYWQEFPLDTLKRFERIEQDTSKQLTCKERILALFSKRILHIFQWICFYGFSFLVCWGLAMVIVWMVLGAMINPQSFLAYATGAMTAVSFFLAKYAQCKKTFFKGWESVVGSLEEMMAKTLNDTLRTIVNADTLGDLAGDLPGGQFLKNHVDVLSGSSLGKNIMSAGFDVEELVHMASGSKEALAAFAEKNGVPIEVLQIMFAFTEGSQEKIVAAIGALLKRFQDKSPVPHELATAMAELAFKPSPQKTQKTVDTLFQFGVTKILEKYLSDKVELGGIGASIPNIIPFDLSLSEHESSSSHSFLEKMGPSGVKSELLKIIQELSDWHIDEEKKKPSRSYGDFSKSIEAKAVEAWEILRDRVSKMDAAMLGIHEQVYSTMHAAVLAEIKALTRDNVAKEALAALMKAEVGLRLGERAKAAMSEAAGLTKQNLHVIQGHLQNLLPPLLRGFVAMFAEQDFQKFVEGLRFVHELVMSQKKLFGSVFGSDILKNFENIAPLFHVLDLVLQTQQIPDAILGLLQEKTILNMPKEARQLIDMILWMRDPSKKHRIAHENGNLLTSYGTKSKILNAAMKKFHLEPKLMIILELLLAFATQDWRFFTFTDNAKKMADCIKMLLPNMPDSACGMMEQLFEIALIMLTASQVTIGPQMFEDCQKRVGLDNASRDDIINLFVTKEVSPIHPPKLEKSRLLEAAAEHVGLSMSEIVGLAHLLLGYTNTPKASGLIRELLYRQNVMQLGVDKFITSILAIVFRKSDAAVIAGLDHLRLKHRFLSAVGLGLVKPGYISDLMFQRAGITNTDILDKRFAVPFTIDKDSDATEVWTEWLQKAEVGIKAGKGANGVNMMVDWKHEAFFEPNSPFANLTDTMVLNMNNMVNTPLGTMSLSPTTIPDEMDKATSKFKNRLQDRESKERKAELARKAKKKLKRKPKAKAKPADEPADNGDESSSDGGESGSEDSDYHSAEHMDLIQKADILQLRWHKGINEGALATLLEIYNSRDTTKEEFRRFDDKKEDPNKKTLLEKMLSEAFNPKATPAEFNKCQSQRLLLQLQDLSTGKQKSLDTLVKNDAQKKTLLKILKLENILGHSSNMREDAVIGLRKDVIKNYSELLRLRDTRALTDLFDLLSPLETKKAKDAIGVFGKLFLPTRVAEAAQTMTYCVLRQSKIFGTVRESLWKLAWHFHLPRFLGPATLMPSISYPPSLKEVGSLFHFLVAQQLRDPTIGRKLQIVIFHLMRIHSTIPDSETVMEELDIKSDPKVERIITALRAPDPSVKIQILPSIMNNFYDVYDKDSRTRGLGELSKKAMPYILFFAGFPFTELPAADGSSESAIMQIAERTGIRREVLQAIDISQMSISQMSSSDNAKFERESVLGLLAPLIESERIAQPTRSKELPTSSLVHSLVSLAYCKTAELEHLAESIQPIAMNPFVLQLLVLFVDLANHATDPRYVESILQRCRVNNDCAQALNDLGQNPQKVLAILEMSYPRLDDKASVAARVERLGLAEKLSLRVVELSYVMSTCLLSHLEGVDEVLQHARNSSAVSEALRPLYGSLGFCSETVPLLATRLFQGDFSILLDKGGAAVQHLLPFSMERNFAASICGVLSHRPFQFNYCPVVLMGALTLKLRQRGFKRSHAQVRVDNQLPHGAEFSFRVICKKTQEDLPQVKVDVSEIEWENNLFAISVDYDAYAFSDEKKEVFVDIWWQCWSKKYSDPKDLAEAQFKQAKDALKELEDRCEDLTVSSYGVAHLWWKDFGIHPLFYLVANRNYAAIRLASELLGIPDALLAFLIACVFDVDGKKVDPLLFADLCAENLAAEGRSASKEREEEVKKKNMSNRNARATLAGTDVMTMLDVKDNVGIDVMTHSSDDESSDEDDDDEEVFDDHYRQGVEEFVREMKLNRNFFPDELLELYMSENDKKLSPSIKMFQGVRGQWQFSTLAHRNQFVCCNYTTFENVGIANLSQLRREWSRPKPTAPDLVMEHAWVEVPDNTHTLLSVMLHSLEQILRTCSDQNPKCLYGTTRGPSVSVMVALSQLHQARENACFKTGESAEIHAKDVQDYFKNVTHGLQVHVRTSPCLRKGLKAEFPEKDQQSECIWVKGSVWGFHIPHSIAREDYKKYHWEEWEWPKDHISDMFYRALAIARFALGCSEKFQDKDLEEKPKRGVANLAVSPAYSGRPGTGQRAVTPPPGKKPDKKEKPKSRKGDKEEDVELLRWTRRLSGGKDDKKIDTVTAAKIEKMVQDVLNAKALPMVFALASGNIDSVHGNYSIRHSGKLYSSAKKLFDGTQELYDGVALIFSTRFDTMKMDSNVTIGSVLRSKFPPPDKIGLRISEWSRLLCWILQLEPQTTTALFQIAHGLVEDKNGELVLPEVLENFAIRLRLVKTATSMQGAWRGGEFLRSLCTRTRTLASVEPLALRLGLSPVIVHAILEAAVGKVDGWIALHKFLTALDNGKSFSKPVGLLESKAAMVNNVAKKTTTAAASALTLKQSVPGKTTPAQTAEHFFQAVEKFSLVRSTARSTSVATQREWMTQVLQAIIPDLLKTWLMDIEVGDEGVDLFDDLLAFFLHVVSNENTAAVNVLTQETKVGGAAALTEEEAERLENYVMLQDKSILKLEMNRITHAVNTLVEPLVKYVMSARPSEEEVVDLPKMGVPSDEYFETNLDPMETQLKIRLKIILQAVFAIARKNYSLLTNIIKVARGADMQQFIQRNRHTLCQDTGTSDKGRMRNFVIEKFEHNSEISNLIRTSQGMRSVVMLQALNVLKEIRENNEKLHGGHEAGVSAQFKLAHMVKKIVERTEQAVVHVASSAVSEAKAVAVDAKHGVESAGHELAVAGRAGVRELKIAGEEISRAPGAVENETIRIGKFGLDNIHELHEAAHSHLHNPFLKPPEPPNPQRETEKRFVSHKMDRATKEGRKLYNAMMHLFCAFASSGRGKINTLLDHEKEEFIQCMVGGHKEIPPILPAISAVACGQLDELFAQFMEISKKGVNEKVMKDVALLENLFMLMGMNKDVFKHMVGKQQKFLPELVKHALDKFQDDGPDALKKILADTHKKAQLEELLNGLMCVLLGYVVGAPPDSFAKSKTDLIESLEKFIKDMMSDSKTLKAGEALFKCAKTVALDMANGKTPDFWKDDPPMITVLIDAAIDLVAPFLAADLRKPLQHIIETLAQLSILQKDPSREGFAKQIPRVVKPLASAFDVPPIFISGVVALAQADWKGAEELCKLFCNVDTDKLDQLTALLPSVTGVMNLGADAVKAGGQGAESLANSTGGKFIKSRMSQITNKLSMGNGDAGDLFALTDIDGNGKISTEEFNMCMTRLGYKLLPSRVTEVFSKVKKDLTVQELNEREFKAAMDYLQVNIASNSLSMLGKSWPRLLAWLAVLTFLLVLVIVFIFLGMSAFTTSGAFSAVINSGMTIAAGVATFKKGDPQQSDGEEKKKEGAMIEEVKDTIISDQ